MKIFISLLVLCSLSTARAQNALDYHNKQYGFTLKYPPNWEKVQPFNSIFAIGETGVDPSASSTFDIEVGDTLGGLAIFCSKYVNSVRMSNDFKQFQIVHRSDSTFKSFPTIEYTCTTYIPQNKKTVEWRSIFFIKGDKVFKLTLSSYPDKFAAASDATKIIYDSFQFQ